MTTNTFRAPAPTRLPFKLLARPLPAVSKIDKAGLHQRFLDTLIAFRKRQHPNETFRPSFDDDGPRIAMGQVLHAPLERKHGTLGPLQRRG